MLFRKQSRSNKLTGVYIGDRYLALATVAHERGRAAVLERAEWCEFSTQDDVSRRLGTYLDGERQPINLVLRDDAYQLLLVEAPRVEASELRAAVRWKVKNLIDFHIDDAVIDVFEIPGQENRPQGQSMMYAVAARARVVREAIDQFEQADLNLQVIDATEMALRNLAARTDEDVRGVAMLYLAENHGIITLTRQSSLYLSRRLEVGTEALARYGDEATDQITLEIQRSLDYYDSHFAQPPLAALRIVPGFEGQQQLAEALGERLNLNVALLDGAAVVDCREAFPEQAPAALVLALGGALRREQTSL